MNTEKIMEDIQSVQDNIREIKSTWGNTIMTLDNIKSGLKADVQKKVDEAYQRGHDDGYEAGCATAFKPVSDAEYQRGLEDAWEAARRIAEMTDPPYWEVFNEYKNDLFGKITASEAIEKLKAYEDKHSDRIEVGDEAKWNSDVIVITRVYEDGGFNWCDGVSKDGRAYHVLLENVKKTGKHYDIQSILEAMRK